MSKIIDKYEYEVPYVRRFITIEELILLMFNIDIVSEEFQREHVASKAWERKFLSDLFRGEWLGVVVISYQKNKYKVVWFDEEKEVEFKNLDSQQRLTMIKRFLLNEVTLESKTHIKDENGEYINIGGMTSDKILNDYPFIYQKFLDRDVVLKTYGLEGKYLSPVEETEKFQVIQDSYHLNQQERRTGTVSEIAHDIRWKARLYPTELFSHLGYKNKRQAMDKNRAHQMFYLVNGLTRAPGTAALKNFYNLSELTKIGEYGDNPMRIYSVLYEDYIKLGKLQEEIEYMMNEIIKDDQFKEGLNESWHNSLFIFCQLINQYGTNVKIGNREEVKWQFLKGHVKLLNQEQTKGGHTDTPFRRALSEISKKSSWKLIVDSWKTELEIENES